MDFEVADTLSGRYYAEQFSRKNGTAQQNKGSGIAFEEMAAEKLMQEMQCWSKMSEVSFEEFCAKRYKGAFCYVPQELEEKLRNDPKLAEKIIKELDGILSGNLFDRSHYDKKNKRNAIVILDENGKVKDYYRQDDGITGPTKEELRKIKLEQEAKRRRRERYVKLLKESALKRKLLEQEANKRYEKKVIETKEEEKAEKSREQNETDFEESKTESEILVKSDGSRVLAITTRIGDVETVEYVEISKPAYMQNNIAQYAVMLQGKENINE